MLRKTNFHSLSNNLDEIYLVEYFAIYKEKLSSKVNYVFILLLYDI